jgi:peptidyl-dipeptidase A
MERVSRTPKITVFCACLLLGVASGALVSCGPEQASTTGTADFAYGLTEMGAEAFIARAEADLMAMGEYSSRASWVMNTYITEDTQWLQAKASAESNTLQTRYARDAARFDGVETDPVIRRKLEILKRGITMPAPSRPGAAQELATINSRLEAAYSTGRFSHKGKEIALDDAEEILRTSRDPDELQAIWEGWHGISPAMRNDYASMVSLGNEGARELGFDDVGQIWRSWYDMEPDAFAAKMDALWAQVAPLYNNLHCYVRGRLNERYGETVQPDSGLIRADLTGNMWAQAWGNIYDVVAPEAARSSYDLNAILQRENFDAVKMVKTGENFYTSLGLPPLPETFWQRSMLTRPRDREVVCHASAWDIDDKDDIRIKMCTRVNADDFDTVHHELGHNFYQRAYAGQDYIFRGGANDGFHEAIGDFAGLNAMTPTYLNQIGLLDRVPGTEEDIPFLLKMALDKIAFLPFGLLIDKWRYGVFSGETPPERYNDSWWELRTRYQGVGPPKLRPVDAFDPGAKYHIPGNTPYARYFLAFIYEFQLYRAACRDAGWQGPLNRCSVYGNKSVGEKLNAMMQAGQSRPWPETLAAFAGETDADASAIRDYFAPLDAWLTEQNRGKTCGW